MGGQDPATEEEEMTKIVFIHCFIKFNLSALRPEAGDCSRLILSGLYPCSEEQAWARSKVNTAGMETINRRPQKEAAP